MELCVRTNVHVPCGTWKDVHVGAGVCQREDLHLRAQPYCSSKVHHDLGAHTRTHTQIDSRTRKYAITALAFALVSAESWGLLDAMAPAS